MSSDALTVWRRLHVEVDSMGLMPAPPDPETNVVKGTLVGIEGNGTIAMRVVVATSPPHPNLDDGSPRLDNSANLGNGRFENETLRLGTSPASTSGLRGNGVDYVEKAAANGGITIPCTITKAGLPTVTGQVWKLDRATQTFSVKVSGTVSMLYNSGQMTVAGVGMTIQSVTGPTVKVVQLADIPFELVDDDAATYPFNVDTSLMQDSVDPARNLFAPAYIKPVYDLGSGSKQPVFKRNVEGVEGGVSQEEFDQLSRGRDYISTNEYWVAYIQGAFQGPVFKVGSVVKGDADPDSEFTRLGFTPIPLGDPLSDTRQGSLVYVESTTDNERANEAVGRCLDIDLLATNTVHEVGHQFGLTDNSGGIMTSGCIPATDVKFLPNHLATMRGRTHP